jgi:predicted ATPase
MDAVDPVGKLTLRLQVIRGGYDPEVSLIDLFHLGDADAVVVVVFVAIVLKSSTHMTDALLPRLASSRGICLPVTEGRESDSSAWFQGA